MFIIKWIFKKPGFLLFVIGVALIISSVIVTKANEQFLDKAVANYATISQINEKGAFAKLFSKDPQVMVAYNVDGVDYERPLNYYEPTMAIGDNEAILYDPDMHERIRAVDADSEKQAENLVIFGGVFAALGVIVGLLKMAAKRKEENSRKNTSVKKR